MPSRQGVDGAVVEGENGGPLPGRCQLGRDARIVAVGDLAGTSLILSGGQ
ncbi:hypothetical protein ACFQU4_30770 [Microlunatus sp. GCM10028923]